MHILHQDELRLVHLVRDNETRITIREASDLTQLSIKELVFTHNYFSEKLGTKPVKHFGTKPYGLKRTAAIIETFFDGSTTATSKPEETPAQSPTATGGRKKAKAKAKKTKTKKAKATKAAPTRKNNARISDDAIIKVLAKENLKREGSRAYAKAAVLFRFNGKTVGAFKKQEGKNPKLDVEKGWPGIELRWCIKKGYVRVTLPK